MIGTTFNLLHENNFGLHPVNILHKNPTIPKYIVQGGFFDCSALKMTKYKEK